MTKPTHNPGSLRNPLVALARAMQRKAEAETEDAEAREQTERVAQALMEEAAKQPRVPRKS